MYDYYLIDEYEPFTLVRKKGGLYETYKKDKGWTEDPDKVGIMTGHIPYNTEITEREAGEFISKL